MSDVRPILLSFIPASISHPNSDPVAVQIGPVAVKWYGLAYLAGFVCAYLILRHLVRKGWLRIAAAALHDLVGWLALGVIIGGRAGWWISYHRASGPEPWYEPLALWHGGMSFHGGLIGVAGALVLWSWRNRAPFWNIADCLSLVAPIGLFLGRIANFINAELVGRPTFLPWGVIFPGENIARHPSQIYEAILEGLALLLILWAVRLRHRVREGGIAALFLVLYGLFRFAVEFTREPDPQVGFIAFDWLTMGQLLSAALVLIGVTVWLLRPAVSARPEDSANRRAGNGGMGE